MWCHQGEHTHCGELWEGGVKIDVGFGLGSFEESLMKQGFALNLMLSPKEGYSMIGYLFIS